MKAIMKNQKELEQKINQLQVLEHNLQNFLLQKQNFQIQLLEIENALKELELVKEDPYRIIGNIIVRSDKQKLIKDLGSKKEILELRLKSIDKQEADLRSKASDLQQSVLKDMN